MTPELNREYPELDDLTVFHKMVELTRDHMKPICGHLRRGQHAKTTGCVRATFRVADDIPADLRHGVFSEPGRSFDAIVRFSNSQDTFEEDGKGTARGLAIKLLNVSGERSIPGDSDTTQDFLMVDHPIFPFSDPKDYLETIGPKNTPVVGNILALGHLVLGDREALRIIKAIQDKQAASPLQLTYWSGAPFWLGPASGTGGHAVKYTAVPHPVAHPTPPPDKHPSPDYLSEALKRELQDGEATFDFKVQLQTDAVKMPVEDLTVAWDEQASPPVTVASLHIPPQAVDASGELATQAESMSFNPWHALLEHRPLGGMNRLRKVVYEASVTKRGGGCPM